jgi:phenylpropionate dioxygenase-like ring-hydroxylating dioxygenase large terminal subunit
MIQDQWYVILASKEVMKNQVLGVKRLSENMVVWRDRRGNPGAAIDKCPHRGIKLSLGKIKDDHLQCPFHGFEYDRDGACKLIPANGRATPVPEHIRAEAKIVREANGFIYLWYTDKKESPEILPPLPWFTNLGDDLVWKGFTDHWKAHYSRAIENQLDVVHIPFIHHTTIGRGIGPVVNGPYTEVTENSISFWPSNEMDRGQTPVPPAKMTKPDKTTFISFIFPNLWQNHIMDSMRITVAFVPVDENNTIFYLRTYQKMVKVPLLRDLYFLATKLFNRIVLHQDRQVVETHQPQSTSLKMDENLIAGDYPVVLYRKKREELNGIYQPSCTDR